VHLHHTGRISTGKRALEDRNIGTKSRLITKLKLSKLFKKEAITMAKLTSPKDRRNIIRREKKKDFKVHETLTTKDRNIKSAP
jgi:hypothetical protein